jgi:molybdopterin-guanine dinucleotide biosynthesis protein A
MGRAKALLPFGPEVLLQRMIRLLSPVAPVQIVVAAAHQSLPELPPEVILTRDRRPGRGPLEGLRAGLLAGSEWADAFFVSGCDTPLLVPDFVRALFELLGPDDDVVVPRDAEYYHPLSAVYHRRLLADVEQLLAEDRLRPLDLLKRVRTREIAADDLRAFDTSLDSLQNVNHPAEYEAALQRAGF